LKVLICQTNTKWLDKAANLQEVGSILTSHADMDVFIFPEMFNTGYIMNPEAGAEGNHDLTISTLQAKVPDHSVVCGSIPYKIDDSAYTNAFIAVNKSGLQALYHKVHLFNPSGEGRCYTPGENTITFLHAGFTILPLICYDLRFPYISYNAEEMVDLIIYSANWPVSRISHWRQLLIARAIENQCYVIGVNRVGQDLNGLEYNGNSIAVDFSGNIIAEAGTEANNTAAVLDKLEMMAYRTKCPFLKDNRKEAFWKNENL
jgi:predicted amidohydrolase